jgi:hypothetical protein
MSDVFASSPGGVLRVAVPRVRPALLTVEGLTVDGSAYQTVRSIITKVEVAESVSRHIATSFGNMITVYALGDRPGEITIGGLLFMEDCNQVNSGFDSLYDFYRNNRLTRRNAAMRIVIGSKVFRSLMRSIVFGGVDSAYGMAQFSLSFDYLPVGK